MADLLDEVSAAGIAAQALERTLTAQRRVEAIAKAAAESLAAISVIRGELDGALATVGLDHRWAGTSLQLRLPDGSWGTATDLLGPPGEQSDLPTIAIGSVSDAEEASAEIHPDPNDPTRWLLDLRLRRGSPGAVGGVNAVLQSLAALMPVNGGIPVWTGDTTATQIVSTVFGRGLFSLVNAAALKSLLLLAIGDVDGLSAALAAKADLVGNLVPLAQIPNLPASRTGSGTFDPDRIPTLDASKIGSGIFDLARFPVLPGQKPVVSAGALADLTADKQAEIREGTIVTTTDGVRQVYVGIGAKTNGANYVVVGDITPALASVEGLIDALTGKQGAHANLDAIAALNTANRLLYTTAGGAIANSALTVQARNLLDDADPPTMRGTIGAIGNLLRITRVTAGMTLAYLADTKKIWLRGVAAGGGGASAYSGASTGVSAAGGGCGGAYGESYFSRPASGQGTFTIGLGGGGGSGGAANPGGAGSSSTYSDGTNSITLGGGAGGQSRFVGSSTASSPPTADGGSATGADLNVKGSPAGMGIMVGSSISAIALAVGGSGGGTPFGGGGRGGLASSNTAAGEAGSAGAGYGGGGGGGAAVNYVGGPAGGAGAPGYWEAWEFG